MQEKYVSLDPNYASKHQAYTDRAILFDQRRKEAQGGQYAESVGMVTGLTAASYMYVRAQRSGFTGFLPFARHNVGHYTRIVGAYLITSYFFSRMVSNVTGDGRQLNHLNANQFKIYTGEAALDKSARQ